MTFYDCNNNPMGLNPPQFQVELIKLHNLILNKNIELAKKEVYNNIRAVVVDGEHLCVEEDYQIKRINVETQNNIITRIFGHF